MANQIKGKYIKNNAIDGSKILMLNDEPLRALKVDGTQESLLKLNGSDQLVLLKMPTVSADAVDGNELVRKSQVDAVASGLQSSINAEKARIDAILDAADADKDTFAEIVALINSVDTANDGAFAAYVLSNNQALADEATARQNADNAEATARENADNAEATARQNADNALIDRLNILEGADSLEGSVAKAEKDAKDYADSAVAAEQAQREAAIIIERANREAADQNLQQQIDALDSGSSQGLAQEIQDRINADNALIDRLNILEGADSLEGSVAKAEKDAKDYADQKISDLIGGAPEILNTLKELSDALGEDANFSATVSGQIGGLTDRLNTIEGGALVSGSIANAVAAEATARENADNAEATARAAADSAEATARENADNAEATARAAADSAEATARQNADNALQQDIDAVDAYAQDIRTDVDAVDAYAQDIRTDLDALQIQVNAIDANQLESRNETFVLIASDVSNGYVDLAVNAVLANSVVMFVGRLGFFEGDDFSVGAAPSGKVRVSFSAGLMASAEAPQEGDIVRLKYLVQ